MKDFRRCYWDSSVFASYLNQEQVEDRCRTVEELLTEARAGRFEIVTSTITLTEVLRVDGAKKITEKQETKLVEFFEFPFIKLYVADREVCERARIYVWRHGFRPKDSIHIATAELANSVAPILGVSRGPAQISPSSFSTASSMAFAPGCPSHL
jgi:predicted nucleic acid-binding protein